VKKTRKKKTGPFPHGEAKKHDAGETTVRTISSTVFNAGARKNDIETEARRSTCGGEEGGEARA
jgi:hypothetical protein